MELGVPNQKGLTEILRGKVVEVTREKVQSSLVPHNSGVKLFLSSENPRDVELISEVKNFETLAARLASLARFVVLDLGAGLPTFTQKLLSMCNERIVVVEGTPSSILHTKILIDEILALGIESSSIHVVLNNRQRTEAQMSWTQVQEKLGQPVTATITPAPELFMQASRLHTPAILAQPTNLTAQQFLKIADSIIEREKAR
jgi:MinD-like ATPase involved in chromosome partitioning or flagellar assembly